MKVHSIVNCIRDEGAFMGVPVTQVTFSGCNLLCDFCNNKAALDRSAGTDWDVASLVTEICSPSHKANVVVLTGGEPCLQADLQELVDRLALQKRFIIIETNGTLEVPQGVNWVSVSPKEQSNFRIDSLCKPNELKYVVTWYFDASEAIPDTIRRLYAGNIWLMPDARNPQIMQDTWKKAVDIVRADPRLRMGIQLHTFMEVKC